MSASKKTGRLLQRFTTDVERGRLKLFAKAIGETNPVFRDVEAARRAGYRDIVAPPTFIYCLSEDVPDPNAAVHAVGLDASRGLHAEQKITQFRPICAGSRLRGVTRLTDCFEKRGGALQFVVSETDFRDERDDLVARLTTTVVVRADDR